MTIETHSNDFERQCSMTAPGVTDPLPGKSFRVYIVTMTAKPVSLPKFMIVAYESSAPACIIHTIEDDPHMLIEECLIPMQCDKFRSDRTIRAVSYKQLGRLDEEVDPHNTVKQSDKISNTDWRKDFTGQDEYSACCYKIINMLTALKAYGADPLVRSGRCNITSNLRRMVIDHFT